MELKTLEECTPSQREFIGTTFPTPKGGVLTVVGCCKERGGSRAALFKVECSICSDDVELFPDGFKSVRGSLVTGNVSCGCAKNTHWNEPQYKVLVERECKKRNYGFLGWSGEFVGAHTKLHLHNLVNGNMWNTTSMSGFLNHGSGCPVAGVAAAGINRGDSQRKPYEVVVEQLTEICNTAGHTFIALPEYKSARVSKFKWVCNKGHNCETRVDAFLRESRCKTCNNGNFGFYKSRIHEEDYLYIYKIKGQPFIKVGRSFEPDRRLKENQSRINKYYGNRKHKITQTHLFKGTHEEIYNLEQSILSKEFVVHSVDLDDGYGSSELLHESCYDAVVAFVEQWEIDRGEDNMSDFNKVLKQDDVEGFKRHIEDCYLKKTGVQLPETIIVITDNTFFFGFSEVNRITSTSSDNTNNGLFCEIIHWLLEES